MAKKFVSVGKPSTFHMNSMKEPDMLELERYIRKLIKQYPIEISWGDIIGAINDQLDLITLINSKQDLLVSGTNIKTISGNSVLGSGDLAVEPAISAGLSSEFWNGDKQFVTVTTSNVAEGVNLYYTDNRARNSVSANTPLAYSSSSGVFTIDQAGVSSDGYLSSADWNSFNSKENSANKASNFSTIDNTKYPTTQAIVDYLGSNYSNISLVSGSTYKNFKIASKIITTSSTSHTIDYSEFGFTTILVPPILTIIRNIANATTACFPILKSYDATNCVVAVGESKTTTVLLLNTSVEGIELVSGINIQITIIGV